MRRSRWTPLLIASLLLCSPAAPALACPNCKEAVADQSSGGADAASGFNWSVLFMVSMPFTLLGTGALMVVRAARRGGIPEL